MIKLYIILPKLPFNDVKKGIEKFFFSRNNAHEIEHQQNRSTPQGWKIYEFNNEIFLQIGFFKQCISKFLISKIQPQFCKKRIFFPLVQLSTNGKKIELKTRKSQKWIWSSRLQLKCTVCVRFKWQPSFSKWHVYDDCLVVWIFLFPRKPVTHNLKDAHIAFSFASIVSSKMRSLISFLRSNLKRSLPSALSLEITGLLI